MSERSPAPLTQRLVRGTFSSSGVLLQRIANRRQLNAPWGMAMAPAAFGAFGGDLLVGNFGDGEINAYQPQATGTYERVGALKGVNGKPILIDGLWALAFGKGGHFEQRPDRRVVLYRRTRRRGPRSFRDDQSRRLATSPRAPRRLSKARARERA